jgi:Zn finger protein HypA/HybF involved in hydrogenase expression
MPRKYTMEEVNDKLAGMASTIRVLCNYINTSTRALFKCLTCGYEWNKLPNDALQGSGCPKCSGKLPIPKEDILQILKEKSIELTGNYVNTQVPTDFKCLICDYEWTTTPSSIIHHDTGCSKCSGTLKLTKIDINQKLIDSNRTVRMVGEYSGGNKIHSQFGCLVCGHEWPARPNDILSGKGCPECDHRKKFLTEEQRIERKNYILKVLEETKRNIIMLGEYINNATGTLFKCLVCGHEWPARPNNILTGYGCPECNNRRKKLSEEEQQQKKEEFNLKIVHRNMALIGEYISAHTKTLFKCLVCDWEWDSKPNAISNGNGCPCCANQLDLSKEIVNQRLEDANRTVRLVGEYIKTQEKSLFECLVCGYQWPAKPGNVLYNNSGCPCCSTGGFDINKPGILYYIKIRYEDQEYYKIGITNKSVQERFTKSELEMIEVISETIFENGFEAYQKEQEILKIFGDYRYAGVQLLKSGNTEIFSIDIREMYENSNFR